MANNNVLLRAIREISAECCKKGKAFSSTFVAYIVKAVLLDLNNDFVLMENISHNDFEKLTQLCLNKILTERSSSFDTMEMQIFFDMNYASREEVKSRHWELLQVKLRPMLDYILFSNTDYRDEKIVMQRRIVMAIMLNSGLGNPTDKSAVKETISALQSVYPVKEFGAFTSLKLRHRKEQLVHLTHLVSGIRLYNRACNKGGVGIEDLIGVLNEAIHISIEKLDLELENTQKLIIIYTELAERMCFSLQTWFVMEEPLKQAAINMHQYKIFLTVLLADVLQCAQRVETLEAKFNSRIKQLQNSIRSRKSIPSPQVFPSFIKLSKLWTGFQGEVVILNVLNNLISMLRHFTHAQKEAFPNDKIIPNMSKLRQISDEDRLKENTGPLHKINPQDFPELEIIQPEDNKHFFDLTLEFRGFCTWALIKHDRLLLPGNPLIGILRYHKRYYVFSTKLAAYDFLHNVDKYLSDLKTILSKSPELIQMLEMYYLFENMAPLPPRHLDIESATSKESLDASTETDLHFLEYNIVPTYDWNEWEMRRKAFKMANLKSKVTHSVQTHLSHMRRDNSTQVYPSKSKCSQTKRDKYANTAKSQIYLEGIRGGSNILQSTIVTKVDLSLDIENS